MRTSVCDMFGIDVPIFAFSHCRDVVVAVSKAGGLGVLGCFAFTKQQLAQELQWIDDHIGGKPYGVDVLMPNKYENVTGDRKLDLEQILPEEHRQFVAGILDRAGIPPLHDVGKETVLQQLAGLTMTPAESEELLDVAFRHPIKLMVSALGMPAKQVVDHAHSLGIKVGALAGKPEHAILQKEMGVDLVVAQGAEAGGHTGTIGSMVLWPQIVDAVAPLPVLAAGGIGRGRQMAAALAMGAEGVWCGSIWLGTRESELVPEMKERLFAAHAEEAVRSRCRSGKPSRMLRSKFTDAWEEPGAPTPLAMPLQRFLVTEPLLRIESARAREYMTYPVGQIVGDMKRETTVRRVIEELVSEFAEATERLTRVAYQD